MSKRVEDIFQPKIKISHDYDFGSTTTVYLKALRHYKLDLKEKLVLLSRNEPLELMCSICEAKPAVNLCSICCCDDYAFFCEECSAKHAEECDDFADYSSMPVVNSPRMGVCGYEGGAIDLDRDGVFKAK